MKLYYTPREITLAPSMPGIIPGGYMGGWKCVYKVLAVRYDLISDCACITVRDIYFWERFWLWLREDAWFELGLWFRHFKRRLKCRRKSQDQIAGPAEMSASFCTFRRGRSKDEPWYEGIAVSVNGDVWASIGPDGWMLLRRESSSSIWQPEADVILDIWQHLPDRDWLLVGVCLVVVMALAYGWLMEL